MSSFQSSTTIKAAAQPTSSSPQDIVFTSWVESFDKLLAKRSTDGGNTFGNNFVFNNGQPCCSPAAASYQNNVYVVWGSISPQNDILFRKSTDGGATFGGTINLSNTPGLLFASEPSIAATGNEVYVVWNDGTLDNRDLQLRKSTNGGSTFGSTINLSKDLPGNADQTSVAVVGKNVYVAWRQSSSTSDELFYRKSNDGGATFGQIINLSNSVGLSAVPAITASGNNVYVVWADGGTSPFNENIETFFRRSTDNGASFERTVNLSNSNPLHSGTTAIISSGNNVYVSWWEENEILYRRSIDGGATFGSIVNLSNNAGESDYPKFAVLKNRVYVMWHDRTSGNFEILYRMSTDNGATFQNTINLSNTRAESVFPIIVATKVNAVLTPAHGVQELKSSVNGMQDVTSSTKAPLNARLDGALRYLTDSSTANDRGACTQLDGFIRTANGFARAGSISPQQASQIIQTLPYSAQAIKISIGCA